MYICVYICRRRAGWWWGVHSERRSGVVLAPHSLYLDVLACVPLIQVQHRTISDLDLVSHFERCTSKEEILM